MRFELEWRRTGAKQSADALKERLTRDGYPTKWWEYIAAVLGYPDTKCVRQKLHTQPIVAGHTL